MTTPQFTSTATHLIDGFESTAHTLIDAWRTGGDRLGEAARQQWDRAFAESSPQLSAETRRNATHARKVFAGVYAKGIELSAAGAEAAVDTVAQVARTTVERAAAWQSTRR